MTYPAAEQLTTRSACQAADLHDPLAMTRDTFDLPAGVIYLDGNSLGALPKGALERAQDVVSRQWGQDLIESWNTNSWFELPVQLGEKISKLIGGSAGGCVVTDTTSMNLFKAVSAAVDLQARNHPERKVIISERENFPTDLYMIEGLIDFLDRGYELKLVDEQHSLDSLLDVHTAVVVLTEVNYRTARLWDMAATTRKVHAAGALVVWDLCHSVGALPIDLSEADADFAVGCTYKYLNGGPGSPAFVWVANRHLAQVRQPLSGWWGHAQPFAMNESYTPATGINRFLTGTQPILSLATMEAGIDVALSVDMRQLREKSIALTSLFIALVEDRLAHHNLELASPRDPAQRGSHVSFRHPEGFAIIQALIARHVIGDYREPEILRFGIAPLYLGFADIWDAVETMREILDEQLWRDPAYQQRGAVT